jgi:hypothetical protein
MTYLKFLQVYGYERYYRLYGLLGGDARLREDALKLVLKKIERKEGKCTKIWYHLDEIADNPLLILHESAFDIRMLVWKKELLKEKTIKKLLNGLPELSGYSVIIDESTEVLPIFRDMYYKSSKGALVDCSKRPSSEKLQDFVRLRLNHVLGMKVPELVQIDLTKDDMTISNLFNIFSILEALNKEEVGLDDLRQFDLLRAEPEMFLVDLLFKKGKQEVLRYDFREIVPGRFFSRLYWSLIQRLQVKSTSSMQPTVAAGKLDMPLFQYSRSRKEVMKFEFRELYRRLYLVFSLMRWREHLGSVYLLLLYW